MTIEQKIKEIEAVLHFREHDGFVCEYIKQALEVIRELKLDNHNLNVGNAIVKEGFETLKSQIDRVRDTNWMRQFIIEHSNDSWNVVDKIVKELQNYILGGEGA